MLNCRLIHLSSGISFLTRSYNEIEDVYFWNCVGVALLYTSRFVSEKGLTPGQARRIGESESKGKGADLEKCLEKRREQPYVEVQ